MHFILDHNVDSAVGTMLRRRGHTVQTASELGVREALDDDLTVLADERGAALVTHDRTFSQRRRRNAIGKHLWLHCAEFAAADLLDRDLSLVVAMLNSRANCVVALSTHGVELSGEWK